MDKWRGTFTNWILIAAMTYILVRTQDERLMYAFAGVFSTTLGHAMSRARESASKEGGSGKGGGSGTSLPPGLLGVGAIGGAVLFLLSACTPALSPSGAAQTDCVAKYAARQEIDACRNAVKAQRDAELLRMATDAGSEGGMP